MIFDLDVYMYIYYNGNTTVKQLTETEKLVLVAVPVDEKAGYRFLIMIISASALLLGFTVKKKYKTAQ